MPISYSNGKIYKLYHISDPDTIYVGSTCEPTLARRLSVHKSNYKRFLAGKHNMVTSFKILDMGMDGVKIELIQSAPCKSRDELHKREGYYIRTHNCVNKYIAGRSIAEYRLENKEKKADYNSKYRAQNRDKEIEYRLENKEKLAEYNSKYRLQNKDKIVVLRSEKVHCDICNCEITKGALSTHRKSNKHLSNATKVLAT